MNLYDAPQPVDFSLEIKEQQEAGPHVRSLQTNRRGEDSKPTAYSEGSSSPVVHDEAYVERCATL
jgi:hypothetical protein